MNHLTGEEKLAQLRKLMENECIEDKKGLQAYIVTRNDAHQSEYIREQDERLHFISGFSGSAGTVIITPNYALLWTDGRYFAQARIELDPPGAWTLMQEGIPGTPTLENWLTLNLPVSSRVGTDPNLMSNSQWSNLQNSLSEAGHNLLPIETNLIDEIWGKDKPISVLNKIVPHNILYSGKIAGDKINDCFQEMQKNNIDSLVLTALDQIAYLLNWRGSDIPFNPVFFAYVILHSKVAHIFVDERRVTIEAKQQVSNENVDYKIHSYGDVRPFLRELIASNSNQKVWISNNSSYALHYDCKLVVVHKAITPVSLMKLIKNEKEIAGMRAAHIRDGIALVKYFSWLESAITSKDKKINVTEISGAEQLEKFRSEQENYMGLSFSTISAVGKHGAIIHYKPSKSSDIPINAEELYLCDSGAQFLDGTTDVTRTLHFGQPTDFQRECFTRVFKGQCQLAMTKFPSMIKGNCLDTLAREYLWDVGLDYLHGTSHGVGSYLYVHELPTMISWRPYPDDPGLQAGMFLSNEPGYYEDDKFGIRIENIELVVKKKTTYNRLNREFLGFETVTLVPIQTKLLKISMLTDSEITYLNEYHKKCLEILGPHLVKTEDTEALKWLTKETEAIKK